MDSSTMKFCSHQNEIETFCMKCKTFDCSLCNSKHFGHLEYVENWKICLRNLENMISRMTIVLSSIPKLDEIKSEFFVKIDNTFDEICNFVREYQEKFKERIWKVNFENSIEIVLKEKIHAETLLKTLKDNFEKLQKDAKDGNKAALFLKIKDIDFKQIDININKIKANTQISIAGAENAKKFKISHLNNENYISQLFVYQGLENIDIGKDISYDGKFQKENLDIINTVKIVESVILPPKMKIDDWKWLFLHLKNVLGKEFKMQKLYQATKDSFNARVFHIKCDRKKPILVMIKSEHNKVFGGFVDAFFSSPKERVSVECSGKRAFVYSVDRRTVHRIKHDQTEHAIESYKDWGIRFGGTGGVNCDIALFTNCNEHSYSYSWLGCSYESPQGYLPGSKEAQDWLAGSLYFRVLEIEVWKIE